MVPIRAALTVDLETRSGRRFYVIDTDFDSVEYVDAFRTRSFASGRRLDRSKALETFDKVWKAFDSEYAMFVVKPQVDWDALRAKYRPMAEEAEDDHDLAIIISEMVDQLEDLHVYVQSGNATLPGYSRNRPLNASVAGVERLVGPITEAGRDLVWGRTADSIGYVQIRRLQDVRLPQQFFDTLQQMAETRGLIVVLRFNGGGSEPLARSIVG